MTSLRRHLLLTRLTVVLYPLPKGYLAQEVSLQNPHSHKLRKGFIINSDNDFHFLDPKGFSGKHGGLWKH
jgi:hypothetical protein